MNFIVQKIHNEGPKIGGLILWYAINIALFVDAYIYFLNEKSYYYVREMLGHALPFARASASCLNFNCMLILLPVCRNLLSLVKGLPCPVSRPRRWVFRVLDKHITFHRTVGQAIGVFTLIHVAAHCLNVHYYIIAWSPNNTTRGLNPTLSALPSSMNGTWINPIRSPIADPSITLITLFPGWTGVIITLALILMYSTSTEIIRRYLFEVFWITHHVFVIFIGFLMIHGIKGVVRWQSNVAQHDPAICYKYYATWGKANSQCPVLPQFQATAPKTWKWLIVPIIIYFLERLIRFTRSFRPVEIVSAKMHKSNVLELNMRQSGFGYLPGQYIFLKCPAVSHFEWHPFTLTSSPNEPSFSVHIRCVGDWTKELQTMFKQVLEANEESNGATDKDSTTTLHRRKEFPRLAVDGPFGSPAEDSFTYPVNVLIGAGIGVTPFVSVLRDIWHRVESSQVDTTSTSQFCMKKVHFFWLCPDFRQFEWFTDYLISLEHKLQDIGKLNFLEINVYLTRGWNGQSMRDVVVNDIEERDCFTGLQAKTHFGRPDWNKIFSILAAENENQRVGVFYCGPGELSAKLHITCNRFTNVDKGVKFYYNKENF